MSGLQVDRLTVQVTLRKVEKPREMEKAEGCSQPEGQTPVHTKVSEAGGILVLLQISVLFHS